jgi:restriction endonuclease S subunit
LPEYLAWVLNKEGILQNFSRNLRASIDRIKGLSVKVPPLSEQQKLVAKIKKNIETKKIKRTENN